MQRCINKILICQIDCNVVAITWWHVPPVLVETLFLQVLYISIKQEGLPIDRDWIDPNAQPLPSFLHWSGGHNKQWKHKATRKCLSLSLSNSCAQLWDHTLYFETHERMCDMFNLCLPFHPVTLSIVSSCYSIPAVDHLDQMSGSWSGSDFPVVRPDIFVSDFISRVAIADQEDARAGSGQITRVRASPRTSHRFGHLRSSSDISGHLGDRFHPQSYNWAEVHMQQSTVSKASWK